jgi:hypothetical protein
MARANFRLAPEPAWQWQLSGYRVVGKPHPTKSGETIEELTPLTSAEAHVVKRIGEGRCPEGTSTGEYLADLHAAAGHGDAEVHVGLDIGRAMAGTLTPITAPALVLGKTKKSAGKSVVVLYDADGSCLLSGYVEDEPAAHKFFKDWIQHRQLDKGAGLLS